MKAPARNTDLRHYDPFTDWISRLDARHPRLCTALITVVLLVALMLSGIGDQVV